MDTYTLNQKGRKAIKNFLLNMGNETTIKNLCFTNDNLGETILDWFDFIEDAMNTSHGTLTEFKMNRQYTKSSKTETFLIATDYFFCTEIDGE